MAMEMVSYYPLAGIVVTVRNGKYRVRRCSNLSLVRLFRALRNANFRGLPLDGMGDPHVCFFPSDKRSE
jgi:hypothetical protein